MAPRPVLALLVYHSLLPFALSDFRTIDFLQDVLRGNANLSVSVPFECQVRVARHQKFDFWNKHLDFVFGRIALAQWETLRDRYTAPWASTSVLIGQTPLFEPYDPTHSYCLVDFLPMTVRGLCDLNFVEEDEVFPAGLPLPQPPPAAPPVSLNMSRLVPNCWNAVYETLRTIVHCRSGEANVFTTLILRTTRMHRLGFMLPQAWCLMRRQSGALEMSCVFFCVIQP
mmetsp:Transcript_94896/g.305446  ORF Transcript_94896/g.305446 Transcript_94896/m.305446 type:complete len:227 (+) Transcript_94896:64-744(+)